MTVRGSSSRGSSPRARHVSTASTSEVLSLYSRGLTTREIQTHIREICGVEVSPDLILTVTEAVLDEVRARRARPPDAVYPILHIDAVQVKSKGARNSRSGHTREFN